MRPGPFEAFAKVLLVLFAFALLSFLPERVAQLVEQRYTSATEGN